MAASSKIPALLFQCTLRSTLLTLTILSLVTFSYLSLKSPFKPTTTNPVAYPLSIPIVYHDLRNYSHHGDRKLLPNNLGTDNFFVTCHDVGVRAAEGIPAIGVVCSPNYNVGLIPHKDVALPQVLQPFPLPAGGNDVENRTTLGFWCDHQNSKLRVVLAQVWENDAELYVLNNRINRATGNLLYQKKFFQTKFCICPGDSQVNNARIADSIHYGCVPVSLSDYYDLPFNDILIWQKFSVILRERDVYKLKQQLKNITDDEFLTLHQNLVKYRNTSNGIRLLSNMMPSTRSCIWLRHHVIKY